MNEDLSSLEKESDDAVIVKTLTQYYEYLATIRRDFEDLWDDVITYLAYDRYNYKQDQQKGKKANTQVYDGTPVSAWNLLVNGLHGNTISQGSPWFGLGIPITVRTKRVSVMRKYDGMRLDEIPEVKIWLEDKQDVMYSAFQRSNFYGEANGLIRDATSIGTATFHPREIISQNKINFDNIHPGQIYIAENCYGAVDTVFRKFRLAAKIAAQKFDEEKFSPAMTQALKNAPYQEFDFIHAIFPRSDQEMYIDIDGQMKPKRGSNNMPWVSYYIECGNKENILLKEGFRYNPLIVWRWSKNSDEWYGRSPAMDAIVDIMKLNVMSRSMINAGQMAVEPAYMAHEKFRNKIRLTPRGVNYYASDNEKITPINQGLSYPIGQDREQDARKIIEDHFHTDTFLMLAKAAMEGRQLSVPQVMEMQGEKAAIMMPTVGRMIAEFLQPVVDVVDMIETEAGRMPPPPEILLEFGGQNIEVDYVGPLAMAQKRLLKTQGIYQGIAALEPLAKVFGPEAMDAVDPTATSIEILKVSGWPAKSIRTQDQIDAIRKERVDQQNQAMQIKAAQMMAQNVPNLSKAPEQGSPIAAMAGAQ